MASRECNKGHRGHCAVLPSFEGPSFLSSWGRVWVVFLSVAAFYGFELFRGFFGFEVGPFGVDPTFLSSYYC